MNEEKKEKDLLNCPICYDIFKEPIIGSTCGHSFCNACIKNCTSNECPLCKRVGQLWIKNFTLASLVDCGKYSIIAFSEKRVRHKSKKIHVQQEIRVPQPTRKKSPWRSRRRSKKRPTRKKSPSWRSRRRSKKRPTRKKSPRIRYR